jgi:hypothetical protein
VSPFVSRYGSTKKRQDREGIRFDPGALAHLLRLRQVDLGPNLVPDIEIEGSETVVVGKEQLRSPARSARASASS